ncbi:hypothetical protein GF406_16935 [candidate division KSB1 bacterium]|nr:hypothetical protein [candidate division KSB1 bacterium]
MPKRLRLTRKSEKILFETLDVKNYNDVLFEKDYSFSEIQNQKDREKAQKFSHRFRGAVRLFTGRYHTKDEIAAKRQKASSITLP